MHENILYDVAVIGGGLAGLSLSIQCADAGYKVALFEKENYPFHKVCGEYISMESYPFLQRLGLTLQDLNLPLIHTLNITDVSGNRYNFPLDMGGFGISRYALDYWLYQKAIAKGVALFTQTKVQEVAFNQNKFSIATSSGIFSARTVGGSWGKRSNIDVKWQRPFVQQKPNKLNNYIGVKYHIEYGHPADVIALHNFYNGYCGISRIEDDQCCLCYLTTADNLKQHSNSIPQMEKALLSRNPHLQKIFKEARFLYKQPLVISQVSFEKKMQTANNILMLGDAAGLITPLCGNGMSMALHSSVIAFANIRQYLQNSISFSQMQEAYTQQWKAQFSKRLAAGRLIQRMFGGNTTTRLFLKAMAAFPLLAKKIIGSTHGSVF